MQKKYFGTVVHGQGRGKDFGFPTINIKLIDSKLDIEKGVYIVDVAIRNRVFNGMMYVGTRPTLNLQETTIEIHILNFNEDIYNEQISFQILHKIRDEIQFESVEKLVEQLYHDKEMVYKYFQNPTNFKL